VAAHLRASAAEGRNATIWHGVATAAFIAAMFAKPTAIVTPAVVVAVDLLILQLPWRRVVWPIVVLAVAAVPFAIIARYSQPAAGVFAPPVWQRLIVAADAIGFYLSKLIGPTPLLIDYGRRPVSLLSDRRLTFDVAFFLLAVCGAITTLRKERWVAGSLAVFIGGMALVLGFVPFDFQDFSTVADRYAYLSMLGVAIFGALVFAKLGRKGRIIMALGVVALSVVSFRQAGLWSDNDTIASHTLAHNPKSLAARMVLGYVEEHRGNLSQAEHHYRAGLDVFPEDGGLNRNLGNLLFKNGRSAEAIPYFQKAYLRSKYDPKLLNNLGSALLNTGRMAEAIDAFNLVLQRTPNHLNAHINLGIAYLSLGKLDEAEQHLRRALEIDPHSASAARWMAQVQARRIEK